jgi:hypothetical protein
MLMDEDVTNWPDPQAQLGRIIRRMQRIQRSIKASRQPASRRELMELEKLGREYACVVGQLANSPGSGLV